MIANDVHAPANVPSSVRTAPDKTPYVTVNRLASRAIFHCPPSLRSIVSVQPARRTAAPPGRRHDDIEVVTQIGPVAEHLSSRISLAPSTRTLLMPCDMAANASLPNGSRPKTMNITSSVMRLSTVCSLQVAGSARLHPSRDEITDGGCVGGHRAFSFIR